MDDRVRGFERAAAGGGDAAAEARVLWERVRRGELDPERVRLAAHVGDPVARLALGEQAPPVSADLRACVRGLEAWGKEALVRACLAAVARVLHLFGGDDVLNVWSREVVEGLARWVRASEAGRVVSEEERSDGRVIGLRVNDRDARTQAVRVLEAARKMAVSRVRTAPARDAIRHAAAALEAEGRVDDSEGEVALALRSALTAWALGGDDPLVRAGPPADPTLWDSPPAPAPLPRLLERTAQGEFVLDWIAGARWLVLAAARGRRLRLTPFRSRAGERARGFVTSDDACVVAWARSSAAEGEGVEVRGSDLERSLLVAGTVEDLAVSPDGQRVVWCTSFGDAPDQVWHLDLRLANPTPARVQVEHAVVRALHFPTHCAIGFITDRAAWDACPPEDRKGALLERHLVRMELLT